MKKICQRTFIAALALVVAGFVAPLQAAEKSEDQLIADFDSPKEDVVAQAMLKVEKAYPNSAKALPKLKAALKDQRAKVRRKAARVLGVWHAEVSREDLNNITAMFKAADSREVMDALISLRGLKAQSTIPEILPLLNHSTPNVIRDACRTLAALGDKSLIPKIEPLLQNSNAAVKKDAADAIFTLKNK